MAVKLIGLFCLLTAGIGTGAAAFEYEVTDLGTLGGGTSHAYGINDAGEVVGSSTLADGSTHAFAYYSGAMHDLGALSPGQDSYAYGVNNLGVATGFGSSPTNANIGTIYRPGLSIKTLAPSIGYSINDSGQAVGSYTASSHGFYYTSGIFRNIGTLGGPTSRLFAINSTGQAVGNADTANGQTHAILTDHTLVLKDLGTLGGPFSYAYGINGAGQVVGVSLTVNNYFHAFLYTGGTMTDIDTLGGPGSSAALSINSKGQIVGFLDGAGRGSSSFLYSDGQMENLNDLIDPASGWHINYADAINGSGEITGFGTDASGQTHAFLLEEVPEPGCAALLAVGLFVCRGKFRVTRAALGARKANSYQ